MSACSAALRISACRAVSGCREKADCLRGKKIARNGAEPTPSDSRPKGVACRRGCVSMSVTATTSSESSRSPCTSRAAVVLPASDGPMTAAATPSMTKPEPCRSRPPWSAKSRSRANEKAGPRRYWDWSEGIENEATPGPGRGPEEVHHAAAERNNPSSACSTDVAPLDRRAVRIGRRRTARPCVAVTRPGLDQFAQASTRASARATDGRPTNGR